MDADGHQNVWAAFRGSLLTNAGRPAISVGATTLSYDEVRLAVGGACSLLTDVGVLAGDRVALLFGNQAEFVIVDLAIQALGAVKVPLNSLLSRTEIEGLIAMAGVSTVLVAPTLHHLVDGLPGEVDVRTVTLDELHHRRQEPPTDSRASPKDPSVIYSSGGTTGAPKGIMHTQQSVLANMWAHLLESGISRDDSVLVTTPLPHAAGLFGLATLLRGASLTIESGFDPDRVIDLVDAERITWTFVVPTMIYRLLDCAASRGWNGGTLTTIQYGAAPIGAARLREAIDRFGPIFQQLYAQTECPNYGTVLRKEDHVRALHEPHLLASCGRRSIMCDVAILDDDGDICPRDQIGEVALSSPYLMEGYWNRPGAADDRFAGRWLRTGDVGRQDAEGFVYLVDRKNDVIISGGMNVYSAEVEAVLAQLAQVKVAAVVGLPHPDWGEAVHAFVVADDRLSEDVLRQQCAAHLAAYKRPKTFEFVDSIPLTRYGKIDKVALRSKYWGEQTRAIN